jgi:hypothetical protein
MVPAAAQLPALPRLELMQLRRLIVPVSVTAAATTAALAPGAAVLAQVAAAGHLHWHPQGVSSLELIPAAGNAPAAGGGAQQVHPAAVQAALRAVAPTGASATDLRLAMGDEMPALGAAEVLALAPEFSQVQLLVLPGAAQLGAGFWSALHQALPALREVRMHRQRSVDAADMAALFLTLQHSSHLRLGFMNCSGDAHRSVQQARRQWWNAPGSAGRVTVNWDVDPSLPF